MECCTSVPSSYFRLACRIRQMLVGVSLENCCRIAYGHTWSAGPTCSETEASSGVQALSDNADKGYMKGMKTLEINPRHPLVEKLRVQVLVRQSWGSVLPAVS